MVDSATTPSRPANLLLARLPPADFDAIEPHLTTITPNARHVFHRQGERIDTVIFPDGGVGSVTVSASDGELIEIATVGLEGFIGVGAFLGPASVSGCEAMMQIPGGPVHVLPTPVFRREIDRRGAFYDAMGRFAQGYYAMMMQSTLCLGAHPVQERLCRWLLMAHDRIGRDEFDLSHEFVATMLGSTRPTVTLVAGTLQQAGLIRYRHARIVVTDRKGLEAAACECYATVRDEYRRLRLL